MHSSVNVHTVNSQQLKFNAVNVKAPEISVVNSQIPKKLVKVLTCGSSRDYRVYGSDTPSIRQCSLELNVRPFKNTFLA